MSDMKLLPPAREATVYHANFSGPERGKVYNVSKDTYLHKRYGALLEKDGVKMVGKIICIGSIEQWCAENGYVLIKAFQLNGYVRATENTEISTCNSGEIHE